MSAGAARSKLLLSRAATRICRTARDARGIDDTPMPAIDPSQAQPRNALNG
jgi:hypothetical protein